MIRLILLITLLTGCGSLKQADTIVTSGQAEQVVSKVNYTDAERAEIEGAIAKYREFSVKWHDFIEHPVKLTEFGKAELENDYQALRDEYLKVERIITRNIDKYDDVTRQQLVSYQQIAKSFDKSMTYYMTINDVATYGAIIANIAAKLL